MPESYQGLQDQIKYVEENIAIKKKLGKVCSFEEGLVKEWRKCLPGGKRGASPSLKSLPLL